MGLFKENKLLFGIIGVALVAALIVCGIRWKTESDAKTVDYVYDYNEMAALASQSDNDISWWLEQFYDMGLTKAGVDEESLLTLEDEDTGVDAEMLYDVEQKANWREDYPQDVLQVIDERSTDDYDVIVSIDNDEMYDFVSRAFTERFDNDRSVCIQEETGGYVFVDGLVDDTLYRQSYKLNEVDEDGFKTIDEMAGSKIMYISLGLLPEKVETVQAAGAEVVPKPVSYDGWNDEKFVEDVAEQYDKLLGGAPEYMILASDVIPGYDDGIDCLADYINENDIIIGMVENNNQRQNLDPDGLKELVQATDYNAVRVFSVWNYIQYRYQYYGYDSYQEVENSLFRPVTERNIRMIYFKPMKQKDNDYAYVTDVQDYRDMFSELNSRLADHGFTVGRAAVMEPIQVSLIYKILAGLASVAAAVIAFCAVFPVKARKWKYGLFGLGAVCVLGAYFVAPNLATTVTSLAAAIFIACLIVIWFIRYALETKEKLGPDAPLMKLEAAGAAALVATVVMGLMTACIMTATLSSINFMLEIDIYRGVKLAQIAVIAFFMLMFFIYHGYVWGNKKDPHLTADEVKELLRAKIEIWVLVIVGIMGIVGYVYLARTGNETSVSASSGELLMRNMLENYLYARPRTKEFLAAFPCVMLFVYSMVRGWRLFSFIFGTAATIGFTSVVNTFMHIRSPLEMGVARTGYSLLFGLIIGAVCVLVLDIIARYTEKHIRRFAGYVTAPAGNAADAEDVPEGSSGVSGKDAGEEGAAENA